MPRVSCTTLHSVQHMEPISSCGSNAWLEHKAYDHSCAFGSHSLSLKRTKTLSEGPNGIENYTTYPTAHGPRLRPRLQFNCCAVYRVSSVFSIAMPKSTVTEMTNEQMEKNRWPGLPQYSEWSAGKPRS